MTAKEMTVANYDITATESARASDRQVPTVKMDVVLVDVYGIAIGPGPVPHSKVKAGDHFRVYKNGAVFFEGAVFLATGSVVREQSGAGIPAGPATLQTLATGAKVVVTGPVGSPEFGKRGVVRAAQVLSPQRMVYEVLHEDGSWGQYDTWNLGYQNGF